MYKEYTITRWTAKTREYYKQKGYKFTKINDIFKVKVDDLTNGSNVIITSICDNCRREKDIKFQDYNKCTKNKTMPYYCSKCVLEKRQQTTFERYGYKTVLQDKKKMKEAMMKKYGYDNPSHNPEWAEKYKKICQERFGVDNVFQLNEIKEKSKQTNLSKYGTEYVMQNQEYKEKYLIGKNNYCWTGGALQERPEVLKSWKKAIMKRDNYTCQCCHRKRNYNLKIVVHHLNAYKTFVEQRDDINNGITLCEECHKRFHKIYGHKGDNTKEQFNEFLKSQETNEKIDKNQ